jgi:Patatin-like phospholipase
MTKAGKAAKTWREVLLMSGQSAEGIFGADFIKAYGDQSWAPADADRSAAHSMHVELMSRIATQPLGYSDGVEDRALTSVFELFGRARAITEANPGCVTFEIVIWHVMNSRVRPFTAKWHPKSAAGELRALDSSDEFRAGLVSVQVALVELDRVLQLIRIQAGYVVDQKGRPGQDSIDSEMATPVGWRPMGTKPVDGALSGFPQAERCAVEKRRTQYSLDPNRTWAAGLALSGGGIRSATFSMGVMVSLAKRNLLPQFDYLSSVSGGGYAASFLTQLLGGTKGLSGFSLSATDSPFSRDEGESLILRRIRHGASYLSGSFVERLAVAMAQAQGVFINLLVLALIAASFGYADFMLRTCISDDVAHRAALLSPIVLAAVFLVIPLLRKIRGPSQGVETWMALLGIVFVLPILWVILGAAHSGWEPLVGWASSLRKAVPEKGPEASTITLWLTVLGSGSAVAGALLTTFSKIRPVLLTVLTALFFISLEILSVDLYIALGVPQATAVFAGMVLLAAYLWFALDVNVISLHEYYRSKLAASFLINSSREAAVPVRLSDFDPTLAHFPIINCALNVPGSEEAVMRGRLSDIFCFTPVATGAPVLGYSSTKDWEKANPNLDLSSAMALSGAAVSPQRGLRTTRYASFWLTLLNLRLGLWLKQPGRKASGPGVRHLLRELTATANECGAFVNVSDGGHIENLGVYELLRRRCRYIVAVDGESDPKMTFHALTNLQRLAYIDFGIVLELNLDDLRLGQTGYSRSHFQFCRIIYPGGHQDSEAEIGYLVYLKLSLTGNEGEFLRRYKLDEPAFPHQSTADQFFSESQFEAYRALGEHVGEKLFLPAITGPLGRDVDIEDWFNRVGRSLLDVRAAATGDGPAAAL